MENKTLHAYMSFYKYTKYFLLDKQLEDYDEGFDPWFYLGPVDLDVPSEKEQAIWFKIKDLENTQKITKIEYINKKAELENEIRKLKNLEESNG